jgi:TolB-like protein/DNA-binding winged helix-turn-helix (wHTH) protein
MHPTSTSPASASVESGFRLGLLTIDPRAGEVVGPGGAQKLDPKVMGVLVMLAQNAGQVLSRADLLDRLWPNVVVTDDVLSRCIYELRRQLGQAAGNETFKNLIETLPKRGYRLKGEVAPLAAPPRASQHTPEHRAQRRVVVIAAAVAAISIAGAAAYFASRQATRRAQAPAPALALSIAVLPFVDLSERRDQGYFGDGIAEEILNRLAQSNELRVIARTSSFALRNETLDIPAIAQKLRVSHVLEGSVRKSGDRIRVTAQLVQGSDGAHLWSETFERGVDDVFAIQDQISAAVATALRVTVGGHPPAGKAPASVEAYERFLRGEFFYFRRSPGDIERAISNFKESVALDPGYARAWAGLSAAYGYGAWDGEPDAELQRLQGEAALKAVALDPQSAVAHLRLAMYYDEISRRQKADEHNRIARELEPDHPLIQSEISWKLFTTGHVDQAIAMQRRAVNRDPLNRISRQNFGAMLVACERYDEARSEFEAVLELDPDAGPEMRIELIRIDVLQGRDSQAYEAIGQLPEGFFRDYGLALLDRTPARRMESDAAFERLLAQQGDFSGGVARNIVEDIMLAEVQAYRGKQDDAFATLDRKKDALERKWGKDLPMVWYLQHEANLAPFLLPLHDDRRWAIFMAGYEFK